MDSLEPCPAECLHTVDRGGPTVYQRRSDIFGVHCQTCRCSTEYYATEAEAIAAWNTRSPNARKRPYCDTCGKDVYEVLCPTCAKWWADNPPPFPNARNEVLEEALADALTECGLTINAIEDGSERIETGFLSMTSVIAKALGEYETTRAMKDGQ